MAPGALVIDLTTVLGKAICGAIVGTGVVEALAEVGAEIASDGAATPIVAPLANFTAAQSATGAACWAAVGGLAAGEVGPDEARRVVVGRGRATSCRSARSAQDHLRGSSAGLIRDLLRSLTPTWHRRWSARAGRARWRDGARAGREMDRRCLALW